MHDGSNVANKNVLLNFAAATTLEAAEVLTVSLLRLCSYCGQFPLRLSSQFGPFHLDSVARPTFELAEALAVDVLHTRAV